jgi:hypothetical protein
VNKLTLTASLAIVLAKALASGHGTVSADSEPKPTSI